MINFLNIIKKRKGLLLVIIPLVLLAVNFILMAVVNPKNIKTPTSHITTPGPTTIHTTEAVKKPQTNPPLLYNGETSKKMIEKLKNRTPLSTKDDTTKKRIIAGIKGKSTVLITAPTFRVEYIRGPDVFMAEIRTTDIGKGRLDAKNWFISQGFTPQGACELPVVYYLNYATAQQMRGFNMTFSPLAPGC